MRTVNNLLQSVLKVNMSREIELALVDSADDFVSAQKEQLASGERSDDTQIFNIKTGSEYYSPSYAKYKSKDSPIDLRDQGNFYNGIEATPESEGLNLWSTDSKTEKLVEDYGKEIFGLNAQSKKTVIPVAGKRLLRNVTLQINER